MKNWQDTLVYPETSLQEVMQNLDNSGARISLVINQERQLLGVITDGNLRRAFLKGLNFTESAKKIMQTNFLAGSLKDSSPKLAGLMLEHSILHIPILDEQGKVLGIKLLSEIFTTSSRNNWVVLMAGGLGTRLKPLTDEIPKPLLTIAGKPVLETILEELIYSGFKNFFIALNYKGEMIKDYFGSGNKYGVNIEYLQEQKRMGTAGALSLFPEKPKDDFLVMNADVLTRLNFAALLDFHYLNKTVATMGVREYCLEVPYGVIQTEGNKLIKIIEKPKQQHFVNAGIYCLNPKVLEFVPKNEYFDMPSLFTKVIEQNQHTNVYPIREYWLDIGSPEDFERAKLEYAEVFI